MGAPNVCPIIGRCILCALGGFAVASAGAQPRLNTVETRYYTLHTDLDNAGVREATLRVTLMAEEYHERTKGLAGTVEDRLPFYLFADRRDYEAAGGKPGTAGVFIVDSRQGGRLMAVAEPDNPAATWHAVQHEGFHQFVLAAIGRGIPIWANEGLAEYFGLGVFTGDQFLVGLIPPGYFARLKAGLAQNQFRSLRSMMLMSDTAWGTALSGDNYVQAWSMVHFLAHGDGGKYQHAFMSFLRDVGQQTDWEEAWVKSFGSDVKAFQRRWEDYWRSLPDDPTADLRAQAVTATLTSYYARAASQRQVFDTFDDFAQAAEAGQLKVHEQDWLPANLLKEALAAAPQVGDWRLERSTGERRMLCRTTAGTVLVGNFKLDNNRVKSVVVKPRRH